MMYICLDCGGLIWEEYIDCYKGVYYLKKDREIEEIERGIIGDVIMVRCFYCKSENMLFIGYKEIDKLNKLVEIDDDKKEERLKLIKKWGWLE